MKFKVGDPVRIRGNSIGKGATGRIEGCNPDYLKTGYIIYSVRYDEKVYHEIVGEMYETGEYFESQLSKL